MFIGYTREQDALRAELRAYLTGLLDESTRAALASDSTGVVARRLAEQMGTDRWLGLGWPESWGGHGRGPVEQHIFYDECLRAGMPVPVVGLNIVGPALMEFGSLDQRRRYLPEILAGRAFFAVGYSEPEAGTDLASLRTAAARDDNEFVINGQKSWMSYYDRADHCWLAARTDPAAPKHAGITVLIVPMNSPGITCASVQVLNDRHPVASVHFEDVRVPATCVVGGEGNGWKVITTALNHERITLGVPGEVAGLFNAVHHWAAAPTTTGQAPADEGWVRANLAEAYAHLQVLRLMGWAVCAEAERGEMHVAHASATKVFGTETQLAALRLLMEVAAPEACLRAGSAGELLGSELDLMYNHKSINTFGGGTNEVQRELIASFGLGLGRPGR